MSQKWFTNGLKEKFKNRHISITESAQSKMLQSMNYQSIDDLIDVVVPIHIRKKEKLKLPAALSEYEFYDAFKKIARKNKVLKTYIGQGYYSTYMPSVILRNVFENPGWYTPYTPYQAEIAQGRLEALVNFQTMVSDITAMDMANASLLDEATAVAEAMNMLFNARKREKKKATHLFVDKHIFPQTLAVLKHRATPLNIVIETGDWTAIQGSDMSKYYAVLVQFPNLKGEVVDNYIDKTNIWQRQGVKTIFAADLLSLTLYTPPGDFGVDVVIGTTQRFGIPLGYGGPHAAYFACKEEYKRLVPGRVIGISIDANQEVAYRMALQTREQHIRREKATSNICTAQALLAILAGFYAVYHGKEGILTISTRTHLLTKVLYEGLQKLGYKIKNRLFFDTLTLSLDDEMKEKIRIKAIQQSINLRYSSNAISISLNETTSLVDVEELIHLFDLKGQFMGQSIEHIGLPLDTNQVFIPKELQRTSDLLTHPVFKKYHSEQEMTRYLKQLERKDIGLAQSMIPLGSCTMKLNAATELIPLSWASWVDIHPFAPENQALGYRQVIRQLGEWLNEITGFSGTSFQPNSGAQGEYAGLRIIDAYHRSKGGKHRNIVLIPQSAHGTNPASAVLSGMKIVIVKCTESGAIALEDLKEKLLIHGNNLSAFMVTYPSTNGIFETDIKLICQMVHDYGGQVYMDGANMNAQIGLTSPSIIGADICHLNLHKTFAIPHGGGGPGMGPICCAAHLVSFLPERHKSKVQDFDASGICWAAAEHSSASILAISYAYIAMMGESIIEATKVAILNANYIKHRLSKHYKILFTADKGCVAHELIIDCREFKAKNIIVEDIAKRLIDYGFHAPTVSFPVVGTLMIEPTESESYEEINRFCDALIAIKSEIDNISGDEADNLLKNAPHTAKSVIASDWKHAYSREQAVYPLPYLKVNKYWPPISRIDNAYGDRNLFCSCPSIEDME